MKKKHLIFLIATSFANNLYAIDDLRFLGCDKTCSFKVITGEDYGGLNCRLNPSFRSPIVKIIPKGSQVLWEKEETDKKGRRFFLVRHASETCYLYVTPNRLAPVGSQNAINPTKQEDLTFKRACEAGTHYTIATVGDILLHGALQRQAARYKDFKTLWEPFLSYFQEADMAYANLEGTTAQGVNKYGRSVKDPGHRFDRYVYSSYPQFNYHPSLINDLVESGFDVVSTANNHSLDRRTLGVHRTIDALDEYGLQFTGTRQKDENRPWSTTVTRNGLSLSWIACTYGTNDILDKYHQVLHCFNSQDKSTILEEIHKQSNNPEIDAVFVTPHWGFEYHNLPNTEQIALAQEFLEAGALAVIGSHPHVLQPMTNYITQDGRETFIIYSLGNFVSHQKKVRRRATVVLFVGLTKNETGTFINGIKFIPAIMNNRTHTLKLAPNNPKSATHRRSYRHILSILSKNHMVEYGEVVVTNNQCRFALLHKDFTY